MEPRHFPRYEGCARDSRDPSAQLEAGVTVFVVCAVLYLSWPVIGRLFQVVEGWLGGAW